MTGVSCFPFPVSTDQPTGLKPCGGGDKWPPHPPGRLAGEDIARFALHVARGGALPERTIELPQVVPASRLAERAAPATVLSGIAALDALTGGVPRGALSEICGPASSGRTSVVLALMATLTSSTLAAPELCALVDAGDSFDPMSAQAAGVELNRLLWVRCSKHRVIGRSDDRVNKTASTIDSLEQALKATDLLLQGGGFGLVVVDLGDVPAQAARRVPLTSWFRFRRAVENTRTVLVVIEREPYAKTCASVVVRMAARLQASGCRLQEQPPAHGRILSGLEITAEVLRAAGHEKKPVRSAGTSFTSRAQWMEVKSRIG